jgi:hypothetical protein
VVNSRGISVNKDKFIARIFFADYVTQPAKRPHLLPKKLPQSFGGVAGKISCRRNIERNISQHQQKKVL